MATLQQKPTVQCEIVLTLDEGEGRALAAATLYGEEAFVKALLGAMPGDGRGQHEASLRRFYKGLRQELPPILARAADARAVFTGRAVLAPAKPQLVLK